MYNKCLELSFFILTFSSSKLALVGNYSFNSRIVLCSHEEIFEKYASFLTLLLKDSKVELIFPSVNSGMV